METAFLKELLWVKSIEKLRYFNFSSVVKYIDADGSQRLITEGYNLFLNNFYHDIWCASKENNTFLKACCFPRQRKNDPARLIYFQGHEEGEEFKVDISYCSCKAGLGKCIHVMGLFHLINHLRCSGITDIPTDISCTSIQQQWHKPRGKRIEPEQVMNMVCPKPKRKRKKPPPVCSFTTTNTNYFPQVKNVETLVEAMSNINPNYPFSYLITPCKDDKFTVTPLGNVPEGSILSYQIANVKPQLEEELLTEVKTFPRLPIKDVNGPHINCEASVALYLSMDECQELEKRTVLQSKCELWFQEREKRLTASKFGKICKRKKEITPAFFRELSGYQNTIKSASMKYGLENEDRARKMYTAYMKSQSKNVTVYHTGLVINPGMPYLGCTPDGKVYDSEENPPYGLLEIKCPKSKINVDLNECCDETFYCSVSDDELCLKTNHDYYYQVQGQLHISGLTWCDFIVFNGKRVWVQRIRIDNEFCEDMTKKLAIFYENHYLSFYLTREKYYKAL